MSQEWITDRRPTEADSTAPHYCVFHESGHIIHHLLIADGEAWKPIPKCEPYVIKAKGWNVQSISDDMYLCHSRRGCFHLMALSKSSSEHMQAAERIAAIYEEMLP